MDRLPTELIEKIASLLDKDNDDKKTKTLFALRLVCRDIATKLAHHFGRKFFRVESAEFSRKALHHLLVRAHHDQVSTYVERVIIPMTSYRMRLDDGKIPGWERDDDGNGNDWGYFQTPAEIYEVQTLRKCMSKYPNCEELWLNFQVDKNKNRKKRNQSKAKEKKGSLRQTLAVLLAICAEIGFAITEIDALDSHHHWHIIYLVARKKKNQDQNQNQKQQWDRSLPLLKAACIDLEDLKVDLSSSSSGPAYLYDEREEDVEWIKALVVNSRKLKNLSLSPRRWSPRSRQLFEDLSVTPTLLPPVETLSIGTGIFTPDQLIRFLGHVRESVRELEFRTTTIITTATREEKDSSSSSSSSSSRKPTTSWSSIFEWLIDSMPRLERIAVHMVSETDNAEPEPEPEPEPERNIEYKYVFFNPLLAEARVRAKDPRTAKFLARYGQADHSNSEIHMIDGNPLVLKSDQTPLGKPRVVWVRYAGSKVGMDQALRTLARGAVLLDYHGN
jgi:hypothetical protein